ncbi:retron system putative HNH endonuclease [Priestia megaterium]|uniref:retron system putative HNH endonuclease n=1 Tax=Priestia megaterium TaxID=1404 RepID=UPI00298C38A2|nr:retron system putative HNH endonuclease [Priestia megaterium]
MIHVIRESGPLQLEEDSEIEKGLAIKHFEIEKSNLSFKLFSVYRKAYVREALKDLFKKKCAYCESFLTHIEHAHIEHWRPKGKVTEEKEHKGYYWLAADWDNLFYTCGVCNSSFKGNKFPIDSNSRYAMNSTDNYLTLERPLLVNPCIDNPELHFDFTDEGTIHSNSLKGAKSIEVYGLNREDLSLRRKVYAQHTIINRLDDIIQDIIDFKDKPDILFRRIKRNIKDLKCYIDEEAEYIALTKSIIKRYREKHKENYFFLEVTKSLINKPRVVEKI